MSSFFSKIFPKMAKGQSMVEMAIIAPLLIFFMLGIFEVGWALRNYLVLVNVNREITRYAIRPGYMNFSTITDTLKSYALVKERAETTVSEQLEMDFDNRTTLRISHLVVDTGQPCDGDCGPDCSSLTPFPYDDLILHPGLVGYEYQAERFGPTQTVTGPRDSRIDFDQLAAKLIDQNNEFNCEVMKKGGVAAANNVIITELYHDQPQLFGFPLISNPFTDPVPLYTHTTMRLINAARSSGGVEGSLVSNIETIGPICLVYPMFVPDDVEQNDVVNIIENGWLKWGSSITNDEQYMVFAVRYPQMSLNDYSQAGGIKETSVVVRKDVTFSSYIDEANEAVGNLVNQNIIIPIVAGGLDGRTVSIAGFVEVAVTSVDLANDNITARVVNTYTNKLPAPCAPDATPDS